jgi:hypothetical protein
LQHRRGARHGPHRQPETAYAQRQRIAAPNDIARPLRYHYLSPFIVVASCEFQIVIVSWALGYCAAANGVVEKR